jgi:hypothetical protein
MIIDVDAIAAKIVALINEKPRSPSRDEIRDLLAAEFGLFVPVAGMSSVEVRNRLADAFVGPVTATEIRRRNEQEVARQMAAEAAMLAPMLDRVFEIVMDANRKSVNPPLANHMYEVLKEPTGAH